MGRRLIRRSLDHGSCEHRGQVAEVEQTACFARSTSSFRLRFEPVVSRDPLRLPQRDVKHGVQVTGALGNRRDTAHGGFGGGNDDMRDPATTMADQTAAGCVHFCTRSDRMVHLQERDAWRSGASGAGCCPSAQSGANEWNGIDRHSNSARRVKPRIVSVLRPPTSLAGPKPSHGPCDLLRDDVGGVVLPDAQHGPTRLTQ